MSSSRLDPGPAETLREAIREVGGDEVFAVGDVTDGRITAVTLTCRGTEHQVLALIDRPRPGQVVIHNHPSGDLRPSEPDLQLASRYGEDGVGFVIIDNAAQRARWVVEPITRPPQPVDREALLRFFEEGLGRAMPDAEGREHQVQLALAVADALDANRPLLVEAATGTGKSLAYLVPAALWAQANEGRVVISTYTKALQAQLMSSDLPLLSAGGLPVSYALLQGRSNYLCRRRLDLALGETAESEPERPLLTALHQWSDAGRALHRGDWPEPLDPALWERVASDGDLSLRHRCSHFATCHYYTARRAAAESRLLVVNHALLLTDLQLQAEGVNSLLPRYHRLVLDEGHHLEDAATQVAEERLSLPGLRRALRPLLPGRRRRGALERLAETPIPPAAPVDRKGLGLACALAAQQAKATLDLAEVQLVALAEMALPDGGPALRLDPPPATRAEVIDPALATLRDALDALGKDLRSTLRLLEDVTLPEAHAQPLLEVRRAQARVEAHGGLLHQEEAPAEGTVRWLERTRERGRPDSAAFCLAPVEVGATLRRVLWVPHPGVVATSATLAVRDTFHWFRARTGCPDCAERVFESPFDHARQAVLALPRDLPDPAAPDWFDQIAHCTEVALRASQGGAFVLCTSYALVKDLQRHLVGRLPAGWPILAQGDLERASLLHRFRQHPRAILLGVDSFWEGVSIKGDQLRLVVIPRLPFRVPTVPVEQARHEALQARGIDPFRAYVLQQAAIRLKQGYGRLIRSRQDRGVVLLLDRRLHERSYGAVLLGSLPPARRVSGPQKRVLGELEQFFQSFNLKDV